MDRYILDVDGRTPLPCEDLLEWAQWMETPARALFGDEFSLTPPWWKRLWMRLTGQPLAWPIVTVSTVFLGLNHSFSETGTPVLFETMIFGGPLDQYQERYHTYDEAMEGHQRALKKAKRP